MVCPTTTLITVAEEGFKKRIEYLKKEGNQAHRAKDSNKSRWFYQRAINTIEKSPYKMPRDLAVLYNNMATVHTSINDNHTAFQLATRSVELDPTYHKVATVTLAVCVCMCVCAYAKERERERDRVCLLPVTCHLFTVRNRCD